MKLNQLTFAGTGQRSTQSLDSLGDQLNVIIDRAGVARTVVTFLQEMLLGKPLADESGTGAPSNKLFGNLEVTTGSGRFRLSREPGRSRGGFSSRRLSGGSTAAESTRTNAVPDPLFRKVFCSGSAPYRCSLGEMARTIVAQVAPPLATESAVETVAHDDSWQSQPGVRSRQWEALQGQLQALYSRRARLQQELREHRQCQVDNDPVLIRELVELDAKIELRKAEIRSATARRDRLDQEMMDLERQRDGESQPGDDERSRHLSALYQRLEDLDFHLKSWRDVQGLIQSRRLKIKDETQQKMELSIDSEAHPYFRAQELVGSLVERIAHLEKSYAGLPREIAGKGDLADAGKRVHEIQTELEGLCDELEKQFRHVRHRTAVAELKQLRGCFQDLDNACQALVRRRHSIIESIHELDSGGAELMMRGDPQFGRLAEKEGYWIARTKLQALPPLPVGKPHRRSGDEAKLKTLAQQRDQLHESIGRIEADLRELVAARDRKLDLNRRTGTDKDLLYQMADVDREIHRVIDEQERLKQQAQVDGSTSPSPLVWIQARADDILRRLSGGQLLGCQLPSDAETRLRVRGGDGATRDTESLSIGFQDQIALSWTLAVALWLNQQGKHLPLILIDPLHHFDPRQSKAAGECLAEAASAGQQICVWVANSAAADLLKSRGATVLEIPLTVVSPESLPITYPLRGEVWWAERDVDIKLAPVAPASSEEPLYRYPIQRPAIQAADAFAQDRPPTLKFSITVASDPAETGLFSSAEVNALYHAGVRRLETLLHTPANELVQKIRDLNVDADRIERWQACAWMMVCIPGILADDARLLVECGICEPEQLEEISGNALLQRLSRKLGPRTAANDRYSVDRINQWIRALASTRPVWRVGSRSFGQRDREVAARDSRAETAKPNAATLGGPIQPTTFHLQLIDSVVAAPSIGAKTAERLQSLGIHTVGDLIQGDADEIARRIGDRRIGSATIDRWQAQARLVCRVPELRGRDAQILVACGIREPEQLSQQNAAALNELVQAFLQSKEGARILRSGSAPDSSTVAAWIRNAQQTRNLQAA